MMITVSSQSERASERGAEGVIGGDAWVSVFQLGRADADADTRRPEGVHHGGMQYVMDVSRHVVG